MHGGVYRISSKMISDYTQSIYSKHASNYGAMLSYEIAIQNNSPSFIVNPVTTDEMIPVAKVSGFPNIERKARSHALNIKYCAKIASDSLKKDLSATRYIIAHFGSGISIASVIAGKIIDTNDALLGMGPFSVQRAGSLPLAGLINYIYESKLSKEEIRHKLAKESGFKGYFGTADLREIEKNLDKPDYKLIYDAMIFQIAKEIGSQYAVLKGDISALILTGGMAKSKMFIENLTQNFPFINNKIVYSGSFELEALVDGANDALLKNIEIQDYV